MMSVPRNSGTFLLPMLLGAFLTAAAQTQPARIAITPEHIASAMAAAGWKVSPDEVKLLSQVTANTRDAWLQVVQVSHWQQNQLKAELRCNDPRACLPFYVLVSEGAAIDGAGKTAAIGPVAQARLSEPEMTPEKPLIRSGDPATLRFVDRGLSITMPVICLENGKRGQKIRVASSDHKRFFKAEIVGPGLLKATTL